MRDQRGGIQLARGNVPQDGRAVAAVHAASLERQVFAVHVGQRQHLRLVVQRNDRDDRVRAGALPCEAEAVRCARTFDHDVRAAVAAVVAHKLERVRGRNGQHVRIVLLHEASPRGVAFAHDDAARAVQQGAQQRTDTGRPGADQEHGVGRLDFRDACRPVACREDIARKQRLPVGNAVRDAVQPLIGIRYAHVFRLSAVDPAAKCPAALRVFAVVDKAVLAEKAMPAEGFHIDGHPVAGFDGLDCLADLLDHADHLVADRDARDGARHRPVFDMQVARADARQRHAHDRVAYVAQHRFGFFTQFKAPRRRVGVCKHALPPPFDCIYYRARRG